jgi:hypothetical protein
VFVLLLYCVIVVLKTVYIGTKASLNEVSFEGSHVKLNVYAEIVTLTVEERVMGSAGGDIVKTRLRRSRLRRSVVIGPETNW